VGGKGDAMRRVTQGPLTSARRAVLVQQGVWDTPLESMPLAMGYLKAMVMQDPALRDEVDVEIANFRGGESVTHMADVLFRDGVPDVMAFSVFGWNYHQFGALSETFKQLNPDGWVIWGGTHVANQGDRVFRLYPWVDAVINGEGEYVFCELLAAYLDDVERTDLGTIDGITYKTPGGGSATTTDRERIQNLDDIPSPFLTGALPLSDEHGRFPYDMALMETARGCPYKCAFCYWGGATGQKMRAFSRERLREEIELFAQNKVDTIYLCDSNFGMRPADEDFVEDVIEIKERYGYPRAIETAWAKNKSKTFYSIVPKMKQAGLHSSFTLALQTLTETSLDLMKRRNMRLNDWEELVGWLRGEGMDCYVELIWGTPGERPETFIEGYDRLAVHIPRIATYPLLLLPNTHYVEEREEFGFVTLRGRSDDFEYVLAHKTMSMFDNRDMQRFLLWARISAENMFFRLVWPVLRTYVGMPQSEILLSLADWFDKCADPNADDLRASENQLGDPTSVPRGIRALYAGPGVDALLRQWWDEEIVPRIAPEARDFLTDVFRYDLLTRPIMDDEGKELEGYELVSIDDELYYTRGPEPFRFDPETITTHVKAESTDVPATSPCEVSFRYSAGYHEQFENMEMAAHFLGEPTTVAPLSQLPLDEGEVLVTEGASPAASGEEYAS
jgi:radical SAM superfamily enzyme YgiQ (UPF0313 family)